MILLRVAATVYFLAHLLVAAAPVVVLARRVTIAKLASNNLAASLLGCKLYEEVKPFLRARIPEAVRELGPEHLTVLNLRLNYAVFLLRVREGRSRDNVVEGVALLEELSSTARRVFGTAHPTTICIDGNLGRARSELASLTAP